MAACLLFAVWAGARAPPQQQKQKKKAQPKQKKNEDAPAPSERVLFLFFAAWVRGRVCVFCCLGGVRVFFLLFGRGACFFLCCLGGCVFIFLLFGRGRVFFLLFGRGCVSFFLLFGRGTVVHSLTGLPGSSLNDPTTKKTKQRKQKLQMYIHHSHTHINCITGIATETPKPSSGKVMLDTFDESRAEALELGSLSDFVAFVVKQPANNKNSCKMEAEPRKSLPARGII